ncbi:hypothetical protein GII33_09100 [Gordonia pseudamarae]|uniref:helix-turn-helix domain-containing protein n=1 Tax=Gordonia TaxID=2053 RepID=UPI0019919FDB|nr:MULTISPECIES: helix-turn-helix domain-containing protein [Gordonia]MBD0021061.1 helix-turn-helix domain-containing protein [Gordonia sp. (in: high G+C Gram-positive bacteria)]QHN26101.1 hypothetical protein GII33_09100 [Gordonia pseudamarae]
MTATTLITPRQKAVATAFWWALLAASAAVSSYGNIRHAAMVVVDPDMLGVAKAIAGALPATLLLMIEGIALAAQAGVDGWPRRVATAIVAALSVIVLASSYVGLYSVVVATRLFDATVLNLGLASVPDLLMVSATVYVMSLRRPAATTTTTVQPPVVEAANHPTTGWLAEPPVVVDAPVPTVVVADPVVASPVAAAEATEVDRPAVVDDHQAKPLVSEVVVDSITHPATTTTNQPPVVVDDHHPDQPVGDLVGDPVVDLAGRVHAETGTTKSVEDVVEVLRLAAEGESQRAIATAVGVDRSLVRRWTQAAKDMQDNHQRRPALVAVSE